MFADLCYNAVVESEFGTFTVSVNINGSPARPEEALFLNEVECSESFLSFGRTIAGDCIGREGVVIELIKDSVPHTAQGNTVHFISDDAQCLFWAKAAIQRKIHRYCCTRSTKMTAAARCIFKKLKYIAPRDKK